MTTTSRFSSAQWMTLFSMALCLVAVSAGLGGPELLELHLVGTLCDDAFARLESRKYGDMVAVLVAERHLAPLELLAREQDVDDLLALVVEDGLLRHHHRRDGLAGVDAYVRLHADSKGATPVRDAEDDRRRARPLIDDRAAV